MPHERDLRIWLRRQVVAAADVEDIVQECYCRLAQLRDVSHITAPRAYLFIMARNIVRRQRERARVVRIDPLAATMEAEADFLTPERVAQARQELGRVQAALATLSDRARSIFIMRRIEGQSQKAIAQALGISETIVENEASRSLRALLQHMTHADADQEQPVATRGAHARQH